MNMQKITQEHQDRVVYLFLDNNNEVQGINFHFGTTENTRYHTIDPVLTKEFRNQDSTLPLFTRIDNVVKWAIMAHLMALTTKTNVILEESKTKRKLLDFKEHFDRECMADLEKSQEQDDFEFLPIIITYYDETIELPMHAQLYDDFMEFLNQQIDNE